MMKGKMITILAAVVLALTLAGNVYAALHVRGQGTITSAGSIGVTTDSDHYPIGEYDATGMSFNLIYDDEQDLTWLDFTSQGAYYGPQLSWADNLVVSFNGRTLDDWRLPWASTQVNEFYENEVVYWEPEALASWSITYAEMGHLYYVSMGNDYGDGLANTGPFTNLVQFNYWELTDHEHWDVSVYDAYIFNFVQGDCWDTSQTHDYYGLAVMPGDVPVPAAGWLLGSGLAGLIGLRRKIKK